MHLVVPRRHPPIIGQPLLRAVELLLADNRRHSRDRDPFGRVRHPLATLAATDWQQGGAPPLGGTRPQAIGEDLAEVDRVGQHPA